MVHIYTTSILSQYKEVIYKDLIPRQRNSLQETVYA